MKNSLFSMTARLFLMTAFLFFLANCGSEDFSACSYPAALRSSLENALNKSCDFISKEDVSELKQFQFTSSDGLVDIEKNHVQYLDQVEVLDFSFTNVVHLPDFVYEMKNLKELNISSTKIQWFEKGMCNLENLEILIGKNNTYKANEVPLYTFCLENLRILDMSNSSIIYIDEYIGKLENLEELYMGDNNLTNVPWMFQNLKKLMLADFTNNRIKNDSLDYSGYTFLFGDRNMNTLFSCKKEDPEDQQECNEEMREGFYCDHSHEDPALWGRGEPLRKIYTDMAGKDLDEFEDYQNPARTFRDRCYSAWLVWMIDFEKDQLLEKTILGKTLREARYAGEHRGANIFWGSGCWAKASDWWWEDKPIKSPIHGVEAAPEYWRDDTGMSSYIYAWRHNDGLFGIDKNWWIDKTIEECPHLEGFRESALKTKEIAEEKLEILNERISNWNNDNYSFPNPEEVKKRVEASTGFSGKGKE